MTTKAQQAQIAQYFAQYEKITGRNVHPCGAFSLFPCISADPHHDNTAHLISPVS